MPFAVSVPNLLTNFRQVDKVSPTELGLATGWGASRTNPMVELAKSIFEARKAQAEGDLNRKMYEQATGQSMAQPSFFDRLSGNNGPSLDQVKTLASILEDKSQANYRKLQADYLMGPKTALTKAQTTKANSVGKTEKPIYSIDDTTGELVMVGTVPANAKTYKTQSVESYTQKRAESGKAKIEAERKGAIEKSRRLANVLTDLAKQFDEAYESSDSPLKQRVSGVAQTIGAKTGLKPNAKIMAVNKNMEFLAPTIVRLAGDVGAIPEGQTMRAISALSSGNLTKAERKAQVDSFIKFALSQASMKELQSFDDDKEARYQAWKASQIPQ